MAKALWYQGATHGAPEETTGKPQPPPALGPAANDPTDTRHSRADANLRAVVHGMIAEYAPQCLDRCPLLHDVNSACAAGDSAFTARSQGVLSARDNEIMRLLERGLPYKQIADSLHLSLSLLNKLLRQLFTSLGAHCRAEAVHNWLAAAEH